MKKLILSAMTFAAMMCATAQNPITPVDCERGFRSAQRSIVPTFLSFGNERYIPIMTRNGYYGLPGEDTSFIFNSDLQIIKRFPVKLGEYTYTDYEGITKTGDIEPTSIRLYNYDENNSDNDGVIYTQTLFNNDEGFEYIKPIYSENARDIFQIEIMSEQGNVIHSITWDDGFALAPTVYTDGIHSENYVDLYVVGGKYYLHLLIGNESYEKRDLFYRIDRQTQSISRVENVPFNVFPTVAERGSDITVQLEEGASAREIVVVDAMGREVKSVPVAQGQREVRINTAGLGAGMGFVSDRKSGAVKIIVR